MQSKLGGGVIRDYERCEFLSERRVFDYLKQLLPATSDIVVYPNFNLFDSSKHAYLECDAIVVTRSFVAIIELKDWAGEILVSEPKWRRGTGVVDSPHIVNDRKCKVLKNAIQHVLKEVRDSRIPYVQSVVALTNESAQVEGAIAASQALPGLSTVTLDGAQELADYLKKSLHRPVEADRTLTSPEFYRLVQKFDHIHASTGPDYADQIPGYRIREEKAISNSYITYVAERNPNTDNRLFRLRCFGKLSQAPEIAEKQLRSLRAAAALKPHPCIRTVDSHPNERNLIVEVSDWSDIRTLEDVLLEKEKLDWRTSCRIARDVSSALSHIHGSPAGLVHRNVCPRSVLLSIDLHAQLTDFDLVYDPGADLTVVGEFAAERLSPKYSAPEVLQGRVDYKSDVYSLGVLLQQMVTGETAYRGMRPDGTMLHEHEIYGSTPNQQRELEHLLSQMRSESPTERPTVADVIVSLDQILGNRNEDEGEQNTDEEVPSYTLIEMIREGASAEIYRVDNHGDVFIHKVFKQHVTREHALGERDVLNAVGRIGLPILFPRVRHFAEKAGHRWCLATDFVPGKTLRELIASGVPPDVDTFTSVAKVLLQAISRLHHANDYNGPVVHNDLTPNNILIDEASGAVGLVDFGAASHMEVVSVRGTPGYIDPLSVSGSEMNASPISDLYSLATTLNEWMLCPGAHSMTHTEVPKDTEHANLNKWLLRATCEKGERYRSAAEMLTQLEEIIDASRAVEPNVAPCEAPPLQQDDPLEFEHSTSVTPPSVQIDCESYGETFGAGAFVSYLNSLHNVTAGNANALAEYQATNTFFGDIYEPIPVTASIYQRLTLSDEVVVVLTGHAGDGKSTIALDILKTLMGVKLSEPLGRPPYPIEEIPYQGKSINVVKDMSEHTAAERLEKFKDALSAGTGSWLIVSNTGPLLNTLVEVDAKVERKVLALLDRPISEALHDESHLIDGFEKPIFVANLSKLDNVQTAVSVLRKIVDHPSWSGCTSCQRRSHCAITKNVECVRESPHLVQRVTWLYRLLTSYERRLTMRQMTAHLAYSITGGHECAKVDDLVDQYGASELLRMSLFSELFFGYSDAKLSPTARSLYCVKHLSSLVSEGRTRPSVELPLYAAIQPVAPVSETARPIFEYWHTSSGGTTADFASRAALRRLLFMFGKSTDNNKDWWQRFVEDFTNSPMLTKWEEWTSGGVLPSSASEKRSLTRQILSVLSEHCTGFPSVPGERSKLYVTLRRDDLETTQPVQVVIGEYDESDFLLAFDNVERMPRLNYVPSNGKVFMKLPLPLLDFVSRRSIGDFGQELDPIFINQLDLFCSQLVATKALAEDDLRLLGVDISGTLRVFRLLIEDDRRLEVA